MKEVMTISGVHVYLDADGTAWLNAEDVARGLGFTQTQNKGEKFYTSIMWWRVNEYLKSFGFPAEVREKDFIPENMFYRLAMKAKNEVAEKFQVKVADDILPTIRKTGMYRAKPVSALEALEQTVSVLREHETRLQAVEMEQRKQSSILSWLKPTEGETPRQTLNRLVKEYATTYPFYATDPRACHQQAWYDFAKVFNTDQHVDIRRRAKNRNCHLIEVIVQDNMLTQAVTVIAKMLLDVHQKH